MQPEGAAYRSKLIYGFTDLDGSQPDAWRYLTEVQDAGKPADVTDYREDDRVFPPLPRSGAMTRRAGRAERPDRFAADAPARWDSFDNSPSRSRSRAHPPGTIPVPRSRF